MNIPGSLRAGFMVLSMLAGNCLLSPCASAADVFSKVQCGSDIPKAIIGGLMGNGTSARIEAAHKALGLKDLGGSEMSGDRFLSTWLICGKEYMLIMDKRSVVRDVLQFPEHSKAAPEFIGSCKINGKE